MRKHFESPELEICEFVVEDIMTTSDPATELPGDELP